MNSRKVMALCVTAVFPLVCVGDNPDFETVEGGALYLLRPIGIPSLRQEVETHRAEFDVAYDCEHVATIMNKAEPRVSWYCSTSVPDIVMNCEISGFELEAGAETGFLGPEVVAFVKGGSLVFSLVLNCGVARGSMELDVPMFFKYTESDSGYLLTSDFPFASGNYFTRAFYLLIIDSATGAIQVRNIGGGANGNGECKPVENQGPKSGAS